VEFMSRTEILDRFDPDGIANYAEAYGGKVKITDDYSATITLAGPATTILAG